MGSFMHPWLSAILILLSWELELCAAVSHKGRAFLKFREEEVNPLGALADRNGEGGTVGQRSCFGVGCADGRVVDLKAGNGITRRLLQVDSKKKGRHRDIDKNQQNSIVPAPSPSSLRQQPGQSLSQQSSIVPAASPSSPRQQPGQSLSLLSSPSHPPAVSPSLTAIPLPITLPPSPSDDVPGSQSSPLPSIFMTPGLSSSLASEDSTYIPLPSPSPTIVTPYPSLSLPPPAISTSLGGTNQRKHKSSRTMYMSIIGGISFLLGITILFAFCCRANKVVTVRPWSTGLSGQLQKAFVTGVPALKRSEIEVACEDFSNIIGSLPDCRLYKGTLSSGVEIAVVSTLITSSKDWSKRHETQFREKISTLSKVNHKNFVNLLGYCEEEEPFTRMMVFEYAPNGTLFEHLHVKEAEHLDWAARLRIAMGVAYCLDHIHQLNPPVVMKTLDSSSIYLTDDYAAKFSDLGFWSESKEKKSPPHWSGSLEVATPEPINTVYGFGLLLIEILSGKIPSSKKDMLHENWASCYLNGERHVKEMMDPTLALFREKDVSALCEVIRSCINPNLEERPTMAEVTDRLKDITAMTPDRATPTISPLWWAELEILTSEAN